MVHLTKQKFICLDCETTGLNTDQDKVIEVAVVCFDMVGEHGRYESLIDPQGPISEDSIKIHNITQQMCAGQPTIGEVLPSLLDLIADHIIVGHGIEFDIVMLAKAAKRLGIPTTIEKNRFIDTLRLARLYGNCPKNSLENLRKHFHIEAEIAHRAMGDVIVNIEVFKKLIYTFSSLKDIFEALSKPILMKTMPLGKHKGREFKDIPVQYLKWASYQDFDQDLLYSIRKELKTRQSGGRFSLASNPFSDL